MPRAGQNVRVMARQRRTKAVLAFSIASLWILLPWVLPWFLQFFFPTIVLLLPGWVYLSCLVPAGFSYFQAQRLWSKANRADQGAAGEEAIATVLAPLQSEGWQMEFGVRDRSVGDVDVFLLSPQGRAYTIDVKSHRGEVQSDGKQLYRQYGRSQYPFERDFLNQAKRQAVAMKKLKRLTFVTPVVAFSQARVEVEQNPIAGVYVVGKQDLVRCLRSLP
ncbi:NERD domain-containing protein [Trichocoleus sp. FACHB-591]|uniref:nuclease-related domain-containing protein n=1 Tax=Trichocoleus sp. FACHB-591 TaxID=2692872 RepID=UPI001685BCF7|nr:NERD domain-containing protein [Trichocoleus sp. FACHB-591]